jgi:hypothetical protein
MYIRPPSLWMWLALALAWIIVIADRLAIIAPLQEPISISRK